MCAKGCCDEPCASPPWWTATCIAPSCLPRRRVAQDYRRALVPLRRFLESDPQIRFLYTVALVGNEPHFILDATPSGDADADGVEDHSSIMERYDGADEEMLRALRDGRPIVMKEPQADQWGKVLSAYAPIRDRTGQPVAIVGLDVTARHYEDQLSAMRIAALAALLPAGILSTLAGIVIYLNQNRKLKHLCEQEESRAALAEALARFEALVENTPIVAIQGLDRHGTIRRWNSASTTLYGHTAAEVVGRRVQDTILAPEDVPAFEEIIRQLWHTGRPSVAQEWPVHTRDGAVRWVISSMIPILSRGVVEEAYCMDLDISDRKRHEERLAAYAAALEKSQAAAESATRAKSAFLASMSHEIRTPLTVILGFADVLLAERSLNGMLPEHAEAIRAIHRNGRYLLDLTSDILDLSKIEAGNAARRTDGLLARAGAVRHRIPDEDPGRRQECAAAVGVQRTAARVPANGRAAAAPDSHQPHRQRDQVHGRRTDPRRGASRARTRQLRLAPGGRCRHRDRNDARADREFVPAVQPGRLVDGAPVRRHGTGPDDQQATGRRCSAATSPSAARPARAARSA